MANNFNIITELNKVIEQFNAEITKSNVLDIKGRVVDSKAFQSIIDKYLEKLDKLQNNILGEAGVVDYNYRNENNLLMKTISELNDMKQRNSVKKISVEEELKEPAAAEEARFQKQGFFAGIAKLFGKRKPIQNGGRESR